MIVDRVLVDALAAQLVRSPQQFDVVVAAMPMPPWSTAAMSVRTSPKRLDMLEHLGLTDASTRVLVALEDVLRRGIRTQDIGGSARTTEVGDAIAARIAAG